MNRPARVLAWAESNFGPVARNRDERAARLVEEAIEVAQCEGLTIEVLIRIAQRVYSRPPGTLSQEIGGLAITLDALAENVGLCVQAEADRELARITTLPKDWWDKKHAEKVAAGTADLSPACNAGNVNASSIAEFGKAMVTVLANWLSATAMPAPVAMAIEDRRRLLKIAGSGDELYMGLRGLEVELSGWIEDEDLPIDVQRNMVDQLVALRAYLQPLR